MGEAKSCIALLLFWSLTSLSSGQTNQNGNSEGTVFDLSSTTGSSDGSVFGTSLLPDEAIYALLSVGGALLIVLVIVCVVIVCKCVRKRRHSRHLSKRIQNVISVDNSEEFGDFYVSYEGNNPIIVRDGRRRPHEIGSEQLSTSSGNYVKVNPLLNMARNVDDSGIFQSSSNSHTAVGNFHGVDGTKVHYTDIMAINPPESSSWSTALGEKSYNYFDSQQVRTLRRADILVEEEDGRDETVGVWLVDNQHVSIHLRKSGEEDKTDWFQEAATLSRLKHANIIKFYGILKDDLCVTIVEEDLPHTLKSYLEELRQKSTVTVPRGTSKLLLTFSQEVALGMNYLADKGFTHGNLMAMNVMVSRENECKITNFGMLPAIHQGRGHEVRELIALKWNAPEVIEESRFTTRSDVWSFGSLLYEIWSLGRDPFEGESSINVIELIYQGRRQSPPSGCPRAIYALMIRCWNLDTWQRPSFGNLVTALTGADVILLQVPQELIESNPDCGKVGQPLSVGKTMYRDLQMTYCCSQ